MSDAGPSVDPHSSTWRAVRAAADRIVTDGLALLEQPGLDQVQTEHARGRIAAARQILALADRPAPRLVDAQASYE